jgi:hypothetical protein
MMIGVESKTTRRTTRRATRRATTTIIKPSMKS